jgi:hypothetical protein
MRGAASCSRIRVSNGVSVACCTGSLCLCVCGDGQKLSLSQCGGHLRSYHTSPRLGARQHILLHTEQLVCPLSILRERSHRPGGEKKKRKIDTRLQPPKKTWFVVCHSVHDGECQATRRNFEINTVVSSAAPPVCYLLVSSQGLCLEFLTPKQKRVFFFFY